VQLDGRPIELLLAPDGTPWVLDQAGASAFGDRGARLARIDTGVPDGMRASAFARVGDDLIFACEHDARVPMRAPILQRVRGDGTVRWSTTLPVDLAAHPEVVQMSADEGWKEHSMDSSAPETWFCTSKTLDISGDAVLACFSEMPRTGIGFGYVLSLDEGALRFATKKGPIQETAALGGGAFLVGYQGYGAFETVRYERDGLTQLRWASHGRYVISGADVRVIEMENALPSKMHLARLLPSGETVRGAWLDGYCTSLPCLLDDGTVLFFRHGSLQAARDLVIDERLDLGDPGDRFFSMSIAAGNQSAYFALSNWTDATESGRLVRVDR
jgi:hypothetical protein